MANKYIHDIPKGMTAQELENFIQASTDPFFFCTLASIIHPIQGKVPFDLYPYQGKLG